MALNFFAARSPPLFQTYPDCAESSALSAETPNISESRARSCLARHAHQCHYNGT